METTGIVVFGGIRWPLLDKYSIPIHAQLMTDDAIRLSNGLLTVVNSHGHVSCWTSAKRNTSINSTSLLVNNY